jgi:hypothetical protein
VTTAFGEAASEASASGNAGAGGVAAAGCGGVAASADYTAEAVASPTAVVVVVRDEEREETSVTVRALLRGGLVGAEAVVDYVVLLVDAPLHLWLATAGEHGECGCGKEGCGDLGGAAHASGLNKSSGI